MVYNQEKGLIKAKDHIKTLNILRKNKEYILGFIEQISAEGLSRSRQLKYIYTLGKVAELIDKDLFNANKNDIVKLVSRINELDLADWTKHNYKVIIKR